MDLNATPTGQKNPLDPVLTGLLALNFVCTDEDLGPRFLALSGVTPDDLRARADDPEILAAVLEFLLANERDLIAFCEAQNLAPEIPARCRDLLPGSGPGMTSV